MHSIYVDSRHDDGKRRQYLYEGQLFVYSPRPKALAFTDFALQMIKEAFGTEDPTTAQYDMPVEEFVRIFAPLKPAFIHHPETKRLIQADAQGLRLRHGDYVLRCAASAGSHLGCVPDFWCGLRAPSSSRYMVLGTHVPVELVAAHRRDKHRELHGIPSAVLE